MFQAQMSGEAELYSILAQELDFFNSVLEFSAKFENEIESMPVNILSKMVNYRQDWVEKIQKLEDKRKNYSIQDSDNEAKKYLKEISDVASRLVEIDKNIYRNLQQRKLSFIKKHSEGVSEAKQMARNAGETGGSKKRVDIVQE